LFLLDEGVNRQGASDALTQVCGFPGTVRCDEGEVLFSSAEWSAERLLLKDECDMVLALGEIDWLSESARRRFAGKRVVVLAGQKPKDGVNAWLPVKSPGIDGGGRLLRLDQVPVKARPLVKSRRAEAATVLTEMLEDFSR
jgi:formylmethanofuran dehydrogenase subunit B